MLPLGTILFPMIAGVAVSAISMETRTRRSFYAAVMLVTDLLGLLTVFFGRTVTLFAFTNSIHMKFSVDPIGRYYMIVVMLLYTCVLFYSFEYMNIEEREHIFFAFYFACFGALLSVALAGNLVTLYLCFEMATLTSMPLVLHEMSRDAVSAALKYLFYSVAGALMGLFAVFVACYYASDADSFVQGGFLDLARTAGNEKIILVIVFAGILGFGTKAGMYPMHGWLPTAHPIAPAPASALLSGIIAKAGIIAIIRLVFFSVGPEFLRGTWVQYAWMSIAMLTIFMGSMMAFKEKVTKKTAGLFHGEPDLIHFSGPVPSVYGGSSWRSAPPGSACGLQRLSLPVRRCVHLQARKSQGERTSGNREADADRHVVLHVRVPVARRNSAARGIYQQMVYSARSCRRRDGGLFNPSADHSSHLSASHGRVSASGDS